MLVLDKLHRLMRSRVVAMGGQLVGHEIDGYTLQSYEIAGNGSGPPLVLLHGLGGTGNSFFPALARLREDWSRIYIPELPGHGFSVLRAGQKPLGVFDHQAMFNRYLDVAVRRPMVLVGHSMGGAIVLQTATERRDVVAVALLAPAGAPFDEQDLQRLRACFNGSTSAAALAFLNALTHRSHFMNRLIAHDMREVIGSPAVQAVVWETKVGGQIDEGHIRALAVPMLLVWGGSERVLPTRGLEFFRRALPGHARIEVMPECGHLPMMEHPRKTAALLADLAKVVQGAAPVVAAVAQAG